MAYFNGRAYTNLRGINLTENNGALRLETPLRTPTTTSGERLVYVNSSDQLIFDDGSTTTALGASGVVSSYSMDDAYNDGSNITVDTNSVTLTTNISNPALQITQSGTGDDIQGTSDTWAVDKAGAAQFTAMRFNDNQLITFGDSADATIGWNGTLFNVAGATDFDDAVTTQGTLTVGSTLTVTGGAGSDAITLTAGDVELSDASVNIIDADDANTLTVTNNSHISNSSATGGMVEFRSTSLVAGALLNLELTEATLDGGQYLRCYDVTAPADVFTINENGAITLLGNASGTDTITVTAGDLTLTSGDATLTSGALILTSGNLTMTVGDQVISDGSLNITDADSAVTFSVTNNTITTTAAMVDFDSTSISTGALVRMDANTAAHDGEILELISAGDTTSTPTGLSVTIPSVTTGVAKGIDVVMALATTQSKGISVTMNAITDGDMLYLDAGGGTLSATGFYINCNDDNASDFTVGNFGATVITGNATGTDALTLTAGDITVTSGDVTMTVGDLIVTDGSVNITDADSAVSFSVTNNTITTTAAMVDFDSTSITTGALVRMDANTATHDGEVLELISAGDTTSTPVGMSVTIPSVTTGAARGIEVTMAAATTTVKGLAITMDLITTGDMVYLDAGGDSMTGDGKFINCNDDNLTLFAVGPLGALTFRDSTEVVTSTNTLTSDESGKVCFLNSATEFVSTLPAPAAGLHFTFIVTAAPVGAAYTVVTNAGAQVIFGTVHSSDGVDGDSEVSGGANSIDFVDGQAVVGDRVEVWCDGTNWHCIAFCNVSTGITYTG